MRNLYSCFLLITFLCVSFVPLQGYAASSTQSLDKEVQIQQLEAEKRILETRANYASREADRLMFQDWLGYRTHIEEETRYRNEIKALDERIQQLKAEK